MASTTVGIDIGTTSVKALAVDDDGRVLARSRVVHEARTPGPTSLEHDVESAWRNGPLEALRALGVSRADGVCVAAMVPSIAAIEPDGTASPGLLYGDERGRPAQPTTASPATSGEAQRLLAWTARRASASAGLWTAQATANQALSGHAVMDAASAASFYPVFDGTGWDAGLLADLGANPAQMPDVAGIGEPAGHVDALGGAVLASGAVDALGEQAVSAATAGDVLVVLGSTLLVWVVTDAWTEVDRLWSIPHSLPGLFLVGGASNAGGLFLDRVRELFGDAPIDVDRPAPDPQRIPVWQPFLRGERTPLHDPDRRGSLHGLDLTHTADDIRRAAFEASGFVVRDHLERSGLEAGRLVVTGGGVRIAPWVAALADTTGLEAHVVGVPEGGALGAAWIARMAAGLESSLADAQRWASTGRVVAPDAPWQQAAADRYRVFRELQHA